MSHQPFDASLHVLLNQSAKLTFVQGEDRAIKVQVQDQDSQAPFDLTGYALIFSLPKSGGGSIKRSTQPLTLQFESARTLNAQSVFTLHGHGLVDGEAIMLESYSVNDLPAPFEAGKPYVVDYKTSDTFGLLTPGLDKVALTVTSTSRAMLSTVGFAISEPVLGACALELPQAVTLAAATGQGLSYQLTVVDPQGRVRIVLGTNELDVLVQPCP